MGKRTFSGENYSNQIIKTFKINSMNKQGNFIGMIIFCCLTVIILASCASHEQNPDDAYEIIKIEKKALSNYANGDKIILEEPKKIELVKKNSCQDEWIMYKIEIEKKIISNENKIKQLKSMPEANAKLLRNVANLEKDNNSLKRMMDDYNEEVNVKWENFKTKMTHNVNEIGIELKDLSTNNKK